MSIFSKYRIKKRFNDLAQENSSTVYGSTKSVGLHGNRVKQFVEAIVKLRPANVLEVGCGYGRVLKELQKHFKPSQIEGSDFAEKAVEQAKKFVPRINTKFSDVTKLRYYSNSFDVVCSFHTLRHLQPWNVLKARDELIRVTKKYLVVCEPISYDKKHNKNGFVFYWDYLALFRHLKVMRVIKIPSNKDGEEDFIYILKKEKTKKGNFE